MGSVRNHASTCRAGDSSGVYAAALGQGTSRRLLAGPGRLGGGGRRGWDPLARRACVRFCVCVWLRGTFLVRSASDRRDQ